MRISFPADELADSVIVGIADIDRSVGGNCGAVRPVERGGARGAAIPLASLVAIAGEGDDRSRADVDLADRVVLRIDDQ